MNEDLRKKLGNIVLGAKSVNQDTHRPMQNTLGDALEIVRNLDPHKDYHMTVERKDNHLHIRIVEQEGGNLPGYKMPKEQP